MEERVRGGVGGFIEGMKALEKKEELWVRQKKIEERTEQKHTS